MSRVSHFQRFSQPENHATNNTLLAFRYFYQSSPFKLQRVLASLIEADLSIGLTFDQQVKGQGSVPDALVMQEALRIYIETKRGGDLDSEQIIRHLNGIKRPDGGSADIPIGLTKETIADSDRKLLVEAAASRGITFAAVTFSQIAEALKQQCAPYDVDLLSIVEDYEAYLAENELLEERNQWLIVVPCGTSIAENVRFGLYYEPASRSCKRNHRFIGLYTQKAVTHIGAIAAIVVATFQSDGSISFAGEAGHLLELHRTAITEAVDCTPYYDLKSIPHRFYLVDRFVPLLLKKTSAGGIMGLRYLDLSKISPSYNPRTSYTADQLVGVLEGGSWE